MDARRQFDGKRVTLMGLGLLGRGVGDAAFLAASGAELIVTDLKIEAALAPSLSRLARFPRIRYTLGRHDFSDFSGRDFILKGAGVPPRSPYIAHARALGIPVRMSADVFAEHAGIPIIGVTGTRGKTTTTCLIHAILEHAGKPALLGGNIHGVSTLSLLSSVTPRHTAVLELDSWQLNGFGAAGMSPAFAAFTNFYPDHLRHYRNDMDAYLADKAQIFLHQRPGDVLVMSEQAYEAAKSAYGSHAARAIIARAADLEGWQLSILGAHNRENAACAVAIARALGVKEALIREAVEGFCGVSGRLELLREANGVRFYNDTAAVIPRAALAGLRAIRHASPLILIMGGGDKGLPAEELAREARTQAKRVILLSGSGTERIQPLLPEAPVYGALREAVEDAVAHAAPGDAVLFSPGFSAIGMFDSVHERGERFAALVAQL